MIPTIHNAVGDVREALEKLEAVFPSKLVGGTADCMHCAAPSSEEAEDRQKFDEVLKAHEGPRSALPMSDLVNVDLGHGPAIVQGSFRRFAYFVPALLSDCMVFEGEAHSFEALPRFVALYLYARQAHEDAGWTPSEREAVSRFFAAALAASLSVPERTGAAMQVMLLTESGVEVDCDQTTLCEVWVASDHHNTILDVIKVVETSWHEWPRTVEVLTQSVVLELLETRFLAEADETAAAVWSRAEETLQWLRSDSVSKDQPSDVVPDGGWP